MKILHLSYHIGCMRDAEYVCKKLGYEYTIKLFGNTATTITKETSDSDWQQHKDEYQKYDVIWTSDTVAISRVFLDHINEFKPHLLIYICNRFDYAMNREPQFYEMLRKVTHQIEYRNKVTIIPYTEFERIWTARHGIWVNEPTISVIGKYLGPDETKLAEYLPNKQTRIKSDFGTQNHEYCTDLSKSFFVSHYGNDIRFMDMPKFLHSKGFNVVHGPWQDPSDLSKYRALIYLPDAFSKYLCNECIHNNIPVFVPSESFLLQLIGRSGDKQGYFFNIEGSGGRLEQQFVTLCEWYRYKTTKIYFDSFDDLIEKMKQFDDKKRDKIIEECKIASKYIEENGLNQWKYIFTKISYCKQQ